MTTTVTTPASSEPSSSSSAQPSTSAHHPPAPSAVPGPPVTSAGIPETPVTSHWRLGDGRVATLTSQTPSSSAPVMCSWGSVMGRQARASRRDRSMAAGRPVAPGSTVNLAPRVGYVQKFAPPIPGAAGVSCVQRFAPVFFRMGAPTQAAASMPVFPVGDGSLIDSQRVPVPAVGPRLGVPGGGVPLNAGMLRRPAVVRGTCSICSGAPSRESGHRVHPRGWLYCPALGLDYPRWASLMARRGGRL